MALTGEWMMALAVKSTLVLAVSALIVLGLHRASAAVRHLVWSGALTILVLMPLMSGIVPRWQPAAAAGLGTISSEARVVLDVVAQREVPFVSAGALAWWIWVLGVATFLAHGSVGMWRIGRIVRRARPLEGFGGKVLLSEAVAIPVVCGIRRPRVVLPDEAVSWPAARLEMVLGHEGMHIARQDTRTYALARLACALYWPNPLVWWGAGRMRREAEQACDDGVLHGGVSASAYAGQLLQIVVSLRGAGQLPEGGLAMGRISELEQRLKALLKTGSSRRRATPLLVAGTCILSLLVLLPVSALQTPAQQSGGLAGVVSDPSGAVVPGARVTAQLQGSGRREFTMTASDGRFSLQPLPAGSYTLTVAKPGFALLKLEGIVVKGGEPAQVKPVLNIGNISASVDVRGERPVPQPPQPEAITPELLRVGGKIQASKMVVMTRPTYPPDCKAEGVQGTVLLMAVIGKDGNVLNLQQLNELVDSRLVTAATEAVRQWRYRPTLLNGEPVEVMTEIEVNFTLTN